MAETNAHLRKRVDEEQEKVSVAAAPIPVDAPDEAPVKTKVPDLNVAPTAAMPAYGGSPTPDPLPE